MENYRIVGTFTAKPVNTSKNKTDVIFKSVEKPKKELLSQQPRNITLSFQSYQPVNTFSSYSEYRGFMWGNIKLMAGDIWPDWDGQRIIIEASSHRIIYIKHTGKSGHKIFIQHPRGFITNVTSDTFNRKAAEKTQITKRIAEWEVHFLTGFVGASHWVGLISVIAADVLEQVIGERKRNTAYREAANDIIDVDKELKQIAPMLRSKILEALLGGVKSKPGEKAKTFVKALPELVIKDDKTTGRIAGAIAAKFIINPNNKNLVWFFIFQTLATQLAMKSATKVPPALGETFKNSFNKLMPNLDDIDPTNPAHQKQLIEQMAKSLHELGVSVTVQESVSILEEIKRNPDRIFEDLTKLKNAFTKLKNAGDEK